MTLDLTAVYGLSAHTSRTWVATKWWNDYMCSLGEKGLRYKEVQQRFYKKYNGIIDFSGEQKIVQFENRSGYCRFWLEFY